MDWLKTQDNYTLYILFLPLDMHPKSREKTLEVLCGKDPAKALELAESDKNIGSGICDSGKEVLARHEAIAKELGVKGTPLFLTSNGIRIPGFLPQQLEYYFNYKQ